MRIAPQASISPLQSQRKERRPLLSRLTTYEHCAIAAKRIRTIHAMNTTLTTIQINQSMTGMGRRSSRLGTPTP